MYQWDFGILWSYRWLFLNGLGVTVGFTVVIVVLGLIFGLLGAFGTLSRFKPVRLLALTFIEAFRCTPLLVQLIWFYYALPILAGVEMTPITASALALSLYGGSFYSEIIRGGIVSIDKGQSEAGAALGMTPSQAMRRIVLPQAIKRMIPALMNQSSSRTPRWSRCWRCPTSSTRARSPPMTATGRWRPTPRSRSPMLRS